MTILYTLNRARSWLLPKEDFYGNALRVMFAFLYGLLILVLLAYPSLISSNNLPFVITPGIQGIVEFFQNAWVSLVINLMMAVFPIAGGIYGISLYYANRRSSNLSSRAGNYLSALRVNKKWDFASVIFFFSLGFVLWGFGNIYWLILQFYYFHDPINALPIYTLYDVFYICLDIFILIGLINLYQVTGTNRWEPFRRKSGLVIMVLWNLVNFIGILFANGFAIPGEGGWLEIGIPVVYQVIDGVIWAYLLLLFPLTKGFDWPKPLARGIKIVRVGMLVFIVDGLLFTAGVLSQDSFLSFSTGGLQDHLAVLCMLVMLHGLIYMVYSVFIEHPSFSFLPEAQKVLMKNLFLGYEPLQFVYLNGDFFVDEDKGRYTAEENAKAAKIQVEILELQNITGFVGSDRVNSLADMIAFYAPAVQRYFPAAHKEIIPTHPPLTKLKDPADVTLIKWLVCGYSNEDICRERGLVKVDYILNKLYARTRFEGNSRSKRVDLIDYYRPEVQKMFGPEYADYLVRQQERIDKQRSIMD